MSIDVLGQVVRKLVEVPAGKLGIIYDLLEKLTGRYSDKWWTRLLIFLRGETTEGVHEPKWHEQDGVISFSVTSHSTSGEQWIARLEGKGFRLSNYAKSVLRSPDFKPTSGVTYDIRVLKGMLFEEPDRVTKKIRAEAKRRKLETPNAEIVCLIRETFSDEEIEAMGLIWIIAMHGPIQDSDGGPSLLSASRGGVGRWLGAFCDYPVSRWSCEGGFAFVASQELLAA